MLKRSFTSQFSVVTQRVHLDGRCFTLYLSGKVEEIAVTVLHLEPNMAYRGKIALLQQIRGSIGSRYDCSRFVAGDFNFEATGEHRLNVPLAQHTSQGANIAAMWDIIFEGYAELYQPDYTTFQKGPTGDICSRVDRLYFNWPVADVLDYVVGGIIGCSAQRLARHSDHCPVFARVQKVYPPFLGGSHAIHTFMMRA